MTIRVNEVTMMNKAGANESTVSRARIWMTTAVCPRPLLPRSTVIDAPSAHARLRDNRKVKAKVKVRVKIA
jgi:hypothetical protein